MIRIGLPSTRQNAGPKIFLRRLKKSVHRNKMAKICHFLNPFHDIGLYSSIARNIYKKPYVLRVDGIYFDKMETLGNNEEKNKPIFQSIANSAGIIFQSEFSKNLVETFYGNFHQNYSIINNGARINLSTTSHRKELNLADKDKIILCLAQWRSHKRLKYILEVYKLLRTEINNLKLLILGKDAKFNPIPGVIYRGEIPPDDLYKYYKSSDLLIDLAWLDNCPNTVVEAICNGLPVVCSNQGGTRELIQKTRAGIVSKCDKDTEIKEYVNLYNPPIPNIETVARDVLSIFQNYPHYKNRINCDPVDIDNIARQYIDFITKIFLK
jgi:glycosyltransferase involved in cell wall biosynthesis